MLLPEPVQKVIDALSRLPGIGPKTASRLAFFLLNSTDELSQDLAKSIQVLKHSIGYCQRCFNITGAGREVCEICANPGRQENLICVVEDPLDVIAIERAGSYQGHYHVLQGVLSPIEGIGPENLKIRELIERIKKGGVDEIIIATNPSMEGDATAMYLDQQLAPYKVAVTRLARGLPVGGDLEYADPSTLQRSLAGRQKMR